MVLQREALGNLRVRQIETFPHDEDISLLRPALLLGHQMSAAIAHDIDGLYVKGAGNQGQGTVDAIGLALVLEGEMSLASQIGGQ